MFLPVIISGGSGERLWPVSRASSPKPFITMPDGESLLQKAFLRASGISEISEILTITNKEHYFRTKNEYAKLGKNGTSTAFILEPFPRNTAPAIAIAANYVLKKYGDDVVILVLPADQFVENTDAFYEAVSEAKILAENGYIVTFGIHPTRPETGFGYMEISERNIKGFVNSYKVKRFTEKPDLETAEKYIADNKYLWNAGIFCFKASVFMEELEQHAPDVFSSINAVVKNLDSLKTNSEYLEIDENSFADVPNISVDYAVLEKSDKVAVVACDIGWQDIGSWNSFGETITADENSNRIVGEVYTHDSNGCIIQAHNGVVATIGVQDLIVVDTHDALLVVDKNRTQEVKNIVAKLKEKNHSSLKEHKTVFRNWGKYTVIEEGNGFKIKRIEVMPNCSLSLQTHEHRSEHWVVISGIATVQNNGESFELRPYQSTNIPIGNKHRLSNNHSEILTIIEVQCGTYLGEDDITRF